MQKQNELPAMEFACKYSLIPNELGYCGKENCFIEFQKFLQNPSEEKIPEIKKLLESFFGLHSYLELIAKANGKKPFDFSVLEAYWLGNELLENISHEETRQAILGLEKFGLPESIARQKADSLSLNAVPHHSLHVLHVNFVTRKLKPVLKNLSNCLVQWAEVKSVEKKALSVKGIELKILNNKFVLQEKNRKIENPFSRLPEKGDFVSVHWNNAIEILSEEKLENLQKYTKRNLEFIVPS